MGRDKALLPLHGQPLVIAVASAVQTAAGSVTLVGNPALHANLGLPLVADLYPGEGPLGGILTALNAAAAEWNLIAACDMPALEFVFLNRLFDAAERSNSQILLPVDAAGIPQPLCAVYHRQSLPALQRAFDAGIRKVTAAFDALRVDTLVVEQVEHFQNVNTPEDWAAYASG